MVIGPGSLKCVAGGSPVRSLRGAMEGALKGRVGVEEVRHLHGDVFFVYTEADTAAIRDWLAPLLQEDESILVVEFERWSGRGAAPDRRWLLARGH